MGGNERQEFELRLRNLEALISEVENFGDELARRTAVTTIQALLRLHGDGLERILAIAGRAGEPGAALIRDLAGDEIVSGLLLLHSLHPVGLEDRVRQALDAVRPYLASRGSAVRLLSVRDDVVRLRLEGTGGGGWPATTLRYAVEQAVLEAAPDVASIEVEGGTEDRPANFVSLAEIRLATSGPPPPDHGGRAP